MEKSLFWQLAMEENRKALDEKRIIAIHQLKKELN